MSIDEPDFLIYVRLVAFYIALVSLLKRFRQIDME